jgi:hypothetical protein
MTTINAKYQMGNRQEGTLPPYLGPGGGLGGTFGLSMTQKEGFSGIPSNAVAADVTAAKRDRAVI